MEFIQFVIGFKFKIQNSNLIQPIAEQSLTLKRDRCPFRLCVNKNYQAKYTFTKPDAYAEGF